MKKDRVLKFEEFVNEERRFDSGGREMGLNYPGESGTSAINYQRSGPGPSIQTSPRTRNYSGGSSGKSGPNGEFPRNGPYTYVPEYAVEQNVIIHGHGREDLSVFKTTKRIEQKLEINHCTELTTFKGLETVEYIKCLEFGMNKTYHDDPERQSRYLVEISLPIDIEIDFSTNDNKTGIIIEQVEDVSSYSFRKKYPRFESQEQFTNSRLIFNRFNDRYNPGIHTTWDVLQILRRILTYGIPATINVYLKKLTGSTSYDEAVEMLEPELLEKLNAI